MKIVNARESNLRLLIMNLRIRLVLTAVIRVFVITSEAQIIKETDNKFLHSFPYISHPSISTWGLRILAKTIYGRSMITSPYEKECKCLSVR